MEEEDSSAQELHNLNDSAVSVDYYLEISQGLTRYMTGNLKEFYDAHKLALVVKWTQAGPPLATANLDDLLASIRALISSSIS